MQPRRERMTMGVQISRDWCEWVRYEDTFLLSVIKYGGEGTRGIDIRLSLYARKLLHMLSLHVPPTQMKLLIEESCPIPKADMLLISVYLL